MDYDKLVYAALDTRRALNKIIEDVLEPAEDALEPDTAWDNQHEIMTLKGRFCYVMSAIYQAESEASLFLEDIKTVRDMEKV